MVGLFIYLSLLILLMIITMFFRIKFDVKYSRKKADDLLRVEMTALKGLVRYKAEVPVVDLDRYFLEPILKIEADIEGVVTHPIEDKGMLVKIPLVSEILQKLPTYIKDGLRYYRTYRSALKGLLKSIRCHHLSWSTQIGFDDPANTGIAAGLLWGAKGFFYRVFKSSIGDMTTAPRFNVTPSFTGPCLKLDFHCIFDMRIGHIILAGLKFAKQRFIP